MENAAVSLKGFTVCFIDSLPLSANMLWASPICEARGRTLSKADLVPALMGLPAGQEQLSNKTLSMLRGMVRATKYVAGWTSSESQSWAWEHRRGGWNSVWEVRDGISEAGLKKDFSFLFFQNADNRGFISSFQFYYFLAMREHLAFFREEKAAYHLFWV